MKRILLLILIAFLLAGCSQQLGQLSLETDSQLEAVKDSLLFDREIPVYEEEGSINGYVKEYYYFTDETVRQKSLIYEGKTLTENLSMRKPNSSTFTKGDSFVSVFTGGDRQVQVDNEWKKVERATTTVEKFDNTLKESPVEKIISFFKTKKAVAQDEFNPGSGDGYVRMQDGTWSTARSASTGTDVNDTSAITQLGAAYYSSYWSAYRIDRAFFPINTGGTISAGATINSATFEYYSNLMDDDGYGGQDLIQTSQADETELATADFDAISYATGSPRVVPTAGQYNTWTLNSTGKGWIKGSGETSNCGTSAGWTCLGIVAGRDTDNATPSTSDGSQDSVGRYSESTGTEPILTVDWSAGGSTAAPERKKAMPINFNIY